MSISKSHTFHAGAVQPDPGEDMDTVGLNTVSVQIFGDSTSRALEFKASVDTETFSPIVGQDMSTLVPAVSTTATDRIFLFDVRGIAILRIELSAIAGGKVTVKGMGDGN